ncbi:MAG: NAD-dependent epimerase [Candidatus Competibacteraceae bacterium]|nr:NAD-dependent epimerase [Candidatus Competibacteraceae bacterium]
MAGYKRMQRVLVTGSAGFIGSAVTARLLQQGVRVYGLDNLNDYYDVALKRARLARLTTSPAFEDIRADLADRTAMHDLFKRIQPHGVVHLAAQAGVRYSLENPAAYIDSNLVGFGNILENCRQHKIQHLVYASSSSVYGANRKIPFAESDNVDHPLSLYAATKKANELMAHCYSHLYDLPTTGLRFFTVYGPWGRPDMALFKFTKAMLTDQPIDVFNYGHHSRDFTYIDDIVEGICRLLEQPAGADPDWQATDPNPARSSAPYRVYNIGNSQPVQLLRYIEVIEECLGCKARLNLLPMQPGDVEDTYADVSALRNAVNYQPATSIETGVRRFVDWYRAYYGV